MLKITLALFLAACLFNNAQGIPQNFLNRTHIECLNQGNPGTLVADDHISRGIGQQIKLRVPSEGLLAHPVTCVLVIDNKNSRHEPQITQGGLNFYYVEVTVRASLLESLDYRIQVYTETPTTTSAATTSGTMST